MPQLISLRSSHMPASCIALRIASAPIARVVRPELREYSVSPTPTIAYLPLISGARHL